MKKLVLGMLLSIVCIGGMSAMNYPYDDKITAEKRTRDNGEEQIPAVENVTHAGPYYGQYAVPRAQGAYSYTASAAAYKPAANAAHYNKPLPAVPQKPAAAPVISAANQTLLNNFEKHLRELGQKINSVSQKLSTTITALKSGDVNTLANWDTIKSAFWAGVRGTQAALLSGKVRSDIRDINQTDAATKAEAKRRATPILASEAFTTAVANLQNQLGSLPEPIKSEANDLVNVSAFLRAQLDSW